MELPKIEELCRGEIKDFILELVARELKGLPPRELSRRRELCEAILACNAPVGEREKMKKKICRLLKNWNGNESQVGEMGRMGFKITTGKTHNKLRWKESAYFKIMAKTPSDRRTGENAEAEMIRKFF